MSANSVKMSSIYKLVAPAAVLSIGIVVGAFFYGMSYEANRVENRQLKADLKAIESRRRTEDEAAGFNRDELINKLDRNDWLR